MKNLDTLVEKCAVYCSKWRGWFTSL